MNRIKRIGLLSCFSVCMFCVGNAQKVEDDGNVEINASCRLQTLEGWGTSLCWWAAQVGLWESKKVNEITNFIVSPDKLNMNIFRYNIGGGDDPSHIGGHMVKGKGRRAEMEGFKVSSTAPYNWNADAAQRKILLMLKKKRKDAIFEAFSNSAPYWMTYSGCAAGNNDALKDNLKPEYYGQFCDYLIDVCKYYKQRFNVNFRTLEPFNESLSNYWYNQGTQEGCHFEPQSQINLIRLLYGKLRASGLRTEISASDETSLGHTIKIQHVYHDAGDIWNKLGQINTHTYSGSDAERSKVHDL
ncbi:MAG: glycoside hydrolase, partial [Bacteroidaceae bacterium]